MNETLKRYEVTPEPFWSMLQMRGYSGYDACEYATRKQWRPIAGWGRDGWDLGSWPYVFIFFREKDGRYEVLEYCEGDVTMYACSGRAERNAITDEIAFFHWKHTACEWVEGIESIEQAPEHLRGPYSSKRST